MADARQDATPRFMREVDDVFAAGLEDLPEHEPAPLSVSPLRRRHRR